MLSKSVRTPDGWTPQCQTTRHRSVLSWDSMGVGHREEGGVALTWDVSEDCGAVVHFIDPQVGTQGSEGVVRHFGLGCTIHKQN